MKPNKWFLLESVTYKLLLFRFEIGFNLLKFINPYLIFLTLISPLTTTIWTILNPTSTPSSKNDLALLSITILQAKQPTQYRAYPNNNKKSNPCLLYSGKNTKPSICNSPINPPNTPKSTHSISQWNKAQKLLSPWLVITKCHKKIVSRPISELSTCWSQSEFKAKSKTISSAPLLMSLPTKPKNHNKFSNPIRTIISASSTQIFIPAKSIISTMLKVPST